ncbi:hypothetical protein N7522_012573 [Penicillium canescens]|nr:hypothetical protein N7522_012573 [Penicillium canescens]
MTNKNELDQGVSSNSRAVILRLVPSLSFIRFECFRRPTNRGGVVHQPARRHVRLGSLNRRLCF